MSTRKINDIEMYYQQQGKGEDLVLIAGASADHTARDPIYERLTQHYRVLRFDNHDVGQTDAPPRTL